MPTPILKFARRFAPEPKNWTTDPAPDGDGPIELLLSENRWLVFDLDVHPGKPNGIENWFEFCAKTLGLKSLPRTWTVKTKSGGLHIYYKIPAGVVLFLVEGNLPFMDGIIPSVEIKLRHIRSFYDPGYVLDKQYMDEPARMPQQWIEYLEPLEKKKDEARKARKTNQQHSRFKELFDQYNNDNASDIPSARQKCFTNHGAACYGRLGDEENGRWFCKGAGHPPEVGNQAQDGTYTGDMVDIGMYEERYGKNEYPDNKGRARVEFIKAWARENDISYETPAPEMDQDEVDAEMKKMEAEMNQVDPWFSRTQYEEQAFVHKLYTQKNLHFTLAGEFVDHAQKIQQPGQCLNVAFYANAERSRNVPSAARYRDSHIERAIEDWQDEERLQGLSYIRERIDFNPEVTDSHLRAWLEAVVGEVRPLDVVALKHFVWLIKRKIFGLYETEFHIMPIVYGKTAGGKTTAVTKLLEPVKELHGQPLQMGILSDERHNYRLNKSYVLFFDEMAWTEKQNLEALKRSITSEEVEWRVMRASRTVRGKNNATLIGAAEKPVRELIHDPNGARRFWQLDAQERIYWAGINAINYREIWQCVDQTQGDSPYRQFSDDMLISQNRVGRAIGSVEEWLTEESFERTYPPNGKTSNENDLYTLYAQWMKSQFREKMAVKKGTFHEDLIKMYGKDVFAGRVKGRWVVYVHQPDIILANQGYTPAAEKKDKPN